MRCADKITASDDLALQQMPVAGQQSALLLAGNPCQFIVLEIILIQTVESEQSQITRQPAQVDVEYEAGTAQWLRSQSQQRADIQAFEHRIHADIIPVIHNVGEIV